MNLSIVLLSSGMQFIDRFVCYLINKLTSYFNSKLDTHCYMVPDPSNFSFTINHMEVIDYDS